MIFGFVVGVSIYYARIVRDERHMIKGLEPITIFNHVGKNAAVNSSATAAVASVIQFYKGPISEQDIASLDKQFYDPGNERYKRWTIGDVRDALFDFGLKTEIIKVSSFEELAGYVSVSDSAPILFYRRIVPDDEKISHIDSLGVLYGLSISNRTVTFNDYYAGYGKTLSYADFTRLMYGDGKTIYYYLKVMTPRSVVQNESVAMPARTPEMEQAAELIRELEVAERLIGRKDFFLASKKITDIASSPYFESSLPPVFKSRVYDYLAIFSYSSSERDIEKMGKYVNLALETSKNINTPFSNFWPGYERKAPGARDRVSVLSKGLWYEAQGKVGEAKRAYEEALVISPESFWLKQQLQRLQNEKL